MRSAENTALAANVRTVGKLMFSDKEFLRGNATMSGVGTDTDWHLSGGTCHVRVDDQRFELPAGLVLGE